MTLPINLYSSEQVRELDRIAIEDFGILGIVLMKRAGQATFNSLLKNYPSAKSITIICGTGNNGGDGYIIAMLAFNAKLNVKLIQLGKIEAIKGDALSARNAYLKTGAESLEFDGSLLDVDIVIDAIFGTGLDRDVQDDWATTIDEVNKSSAMVISVDCPSGLNSDTGRVLGTAVNADLTVTYIGMKCGLLTGQARDYVGKLEFYDLDVPEEIYQRLTDFVDKSIIPKNIIQQNLGRRPRCSHKGNFGHVLLIGGFEGMSGAITLAAEASLRVGAGLVSIATDSIHANCLNTNRPEFMVSGIDQAEALLPLIDKSTVIVIGPGLGKSDRARELLSVAFKSGNPKVLDADALNLLASLEKQDDNWILTPHPAEAARLLGCDTQEIEQDRFESTSKIVKTRGGVLILKGAGSLISDGNKTSVCTLGNPGMSSGGMGDVLSGIIGGLLAQELPLYEAAKTGVFIHAKAADLAVQKGGERGLLASDLFPYIRHLVNE